ncbi:MAG: DUF7331 family protein [Halodesulfurarchaeum sp.]
MSDHANDNGRGSDETQRALENRENSFEEYRTDDGVVIYDANNLLAWVKSSRAVSLDKQL